MSKRKDTINRSSNCTDIGVCTKCLKKQAGSSFNVVASCITDQKSFKYSNTIETTTEYLKLGSTIEYFLCLECQLKARWYELKFIVGSLSLLSLLGLLVALYISVPILFLLMAFPEYIIWVALLIFILCGFWIPSVVSDVLKLKRGCNTVLSDESLLHIIKEDLSSKIKEELSVDPVLMTEESWNEIEVN